MNSTNRFRGIVRTRGSTVMDIEDQVFVVRDRLAGDRARARAENAANAAKRARGAGSSGPTWRSVAVGGRTRLGNALVAIGSGIAGERSADRAQQGQAQGHAGGNAAHSAGC